MQCAARYCGVAGSSGCVNGVNVVPMEPAATCTDFPPE